MHAGVGLAPATVAKRLSALRLVLGAANLRLVCLVAAGIFALLSVLQFFTLPTCHNYLQATRPTTAEPATS